MQVLICVMNLTGHACMVAGEQAGRGGAQGGGAVREAHRGGGRPRRPPRRPDAAQLRRQRRPGDQFFPPSSSYIAFLEFLRRRRDVCCCFVCFVPWLSLCLCLASFLDRPAGCMHALLQAASQFLIFFLLFQKRSIFLLFLKFPKLGREIIREKRGLWIW